MPKEHKPFKIDILANHPLFLAGTRERAKEVGLAMALAEKMRAANVTVTFDGDTSLFNQANDPALFVGDHSTGFENIVMLAAFGLFPREDVKFTAKPFALTNHLISALGQDEDQYTIPLIPQTMAKDRPGGAVVSKRLFARDLLTRDEIRTQNAAALQTTATELSGGKAIVIYPTGESNDARTNQWFRGIGEVIKQVRPETRRDIPIIPFFCEGIKPLSLVRALIASSIGLKPKEQHIVIHLGTQEKIDDVFQGAQSVDSISSVEITEILRQRFILDFPVSSRRGR